MEESTDLKKIFSFLQWVVYASIVLEILVMLLPTNTHIPPAIGQVLDRLGAIIIYQNIFYAKAFTIFLILIVSIGTKSMKDIELDPVKHILLPLFFGLILFFGSAVFYYHNYGLDLVLGMSLFDILYSISSFLGAIMIHVSLANVSKRIQSNLMKDKFNVENESFDQERKHISNEHSINIPIRFYYKKRVNDGWLNITNPFRGTLLIGVPGSGKTFSVVIPFIRQHLAKGFSMMVYDFKFPDLGKVAYFNYLVNKKKGRLKNHKFHVLNLNDIEKSRRINPLRAEYIKTLADASETAEALVEALRKSDKSQGADQFFNQSAINFLAASIYFFSRFEGGRYSTLPHVLSFLNRSYQEIFDLLYQEHELESLLSPFRSAYINKAFDQLEGQLGTLKINISRLATKETFWVFSGDDFNLKISDPKDPSVLVIANDIETQSINSACYSVVINRLTRLINKPGNLPTSLIVDEVPTLYLHRIENLIATARSNKVAILMGLQELPQFKQQYGKETAETICSVAANVISGSARHKETLDWLEKLFGKVRQIRGGLNIDRTRTTVSMNEYMDNLIPASKIANLRAGELVGQVAMDADKKFDGKFVTSVYNCKINIDEAAFRKEAKNYIDLPDFYNFGGIESKNDMLRKNYLKIKNDIDNIISVYI